ncbi:hypothetical protein RJ639_041076 [Escallonia herrerae]|uniref:Peptidase C14 caspase domain-containing protein n=1 Tax=Escallonia herrerae TaxID=1293975 RepID=A0AA88WTV6_9ASTE|nr:hypothetical protein RJ639_041076 [Escallonia herrerae]
MGDRAVVCKQCSKVSSVTNLTETIRCHGCRKLISIGKNELAMPSAATMQFDTDAKGFRTRNPFNKKCLGRLSPNTSTAKKVSYSESDSISEWKATPGKRALLCGVTYNKQKYKLRGTIHDVNSMRDLLLQKFNFPRSSIHILTEDEANPPTKKNIRAALQWLIKDCQAGDSLVFYFSGHGLRQPDFNGDERDGFDETICPVDFRTEGMILDNEINETIVRPLKRGATLHAIIDACHSGTVLDLAYCYSMNEKKWEDNAPPSGVSKGTSGGCAICFSACEDDQLAADTTAFSRKEMVGAMTFTFIRAIRDNPRITYRDLLTSMHKDIKEASQAGCLNLRRIFNRTILQEPLLSSSEPFDVNTEFKL